MKDPLKPACDPLSSSRRELVLFISCFIFTLIRQKSAFVRFTYDIFVRVHNPYYADRPI